MTHPDTDTDDPTSEGEERPERQCVAIADETGERCQNVPIPGVDRCHTHIDYAELAEAIDDEPMTATAPEDGRHLAADNQEISKSKMSNSPTPDAKEKAPLKKDPQGATANAGGDAR